MLGDEPQGWRRLQEEAQRERDPQKLALLIDPLNQLLNEQEKRRIEGDGWRDSDDRKHPSGIFAQEEGQSGGARLSNSERNVAIRARRRS